MHLLNPDEFLTALNLLHQTIRVTPIEGNEEIWALFNGYLVLMAKALGLGPDEVGSAFNMLIDFISNQDESSGTVDIEQAADLYMMIMMPEDAIKQ